MRRAIVFITAQLPGVRFGLHAIYTRLPNLLLAPFNLDPPASFFAKVRDSLLSSIPFHFHRLQILPGPAHRPFFIACWLPVPPG